MYVEILKELGVYLICALVSFIGAKLGNKTKKTKSVEDIKATADKKYHAYVEKQCKKNKIENVLIETSENKETEV